MQLFDRLTIWLSGNTTLLYCLHIYVITLLLLIFGFIALSGLLAMIDAAILSVSRAEVEELVIHKKRGSIPLQWIAKHMTKAVIVIVIFTNIINVLGPILAGKKAIDLYGNTAIGVITAILTFGTIIFSEIIPKSLGVHYAPTISRLFAPAIVVSIWGLYPIVILLEKLTEFFKTGKRRIGTEEQIRSLVRIGHKAGHIEHDEGQLIQRAFVLNDRLAADIMVPREQIVGIEQNTSIRDAAELVFQHHYSRYPVYDKTIDDIDGLAMSQDILEALSEGKDGDPIATVMRDILLVPGSKRSDDLLVLFRNRFIHLAIVRDDQKTIGLVTLEDVLEELVGEIEDETDVEVRAKKS